MESSLQSKKTKMFSTKTTKAVLIVIIGLLLLTITIIAQIAYTMLKYDKIYNGIYISNIHIGEMSKEDALDVLKTNIDSDIDDLEISVEVGNTVKTFKYADIEARYDLEKAIDEAYKIGRLGSSSERLREILNARIMGKKVYLTVAYNNEKLEEYVQSIYDKTYLPVVESDIVEREDQIFLQIGSSGKEIDRAELQRRLADSIQKRNNISIEVPLNQISPKEIDIEDLYNKINIKPVNASLKVEGRNSVIIPHIVGRTIDKEYLNEHIPSFSREEGKEFLLPVEILEPEITTDRFKSELFRDTLSVYGTKFSTSSQNDANRAENIKKSVDTINGLILSPGQKFSFNDVVGPRTEEAGYKSANAYANGQVVESFGGGICQASSTLYNSVLLADLKVTERVNHMFTVSYVPYGRDATVSYGEIDFQFENSTKWPIKIEAWITEDNMVYFRIKGTKENPDRTVEYTQNIIKTTDFPIRYVDDPNLPEGTNIIKQYGSKGYVVDTYKIIKEGGNIVNQYKIHTSVYHPLYQEVIRGTKKVESENEDYTDIDSDILEEDTLSTGAPDVTDAEGGDDVEDADNSQTTSLPESSDSLNNDFSDNHPTETDVSESEKTENNSTESDETHEY